MSQAKVTDNFAVHPKKLHLLVSGKKYNPGKNTKSVKDQKPLQRKQRRTHRTNHRTNQKETLRKTTQQRQPKMTHWILTAMRTYQTDLESNNMMRESLAMTHLHNQGMMNQKVSA